MPKLKAFFLSCALIIIGHFQTPADTLSAAYLGFDRDKAPEFIATLEKEVYQKILFYPGIRYAAPDSLARARQRGLLPAGQILSAEQSESACVRLGCRILIFAKVEKAEIRPERLFFLPLWGRYVGDLQILLWVFDADIKAFRVMDPIAIQARTKSAFAGFGGFSRNYPLTSIERMAIVKQWIWMTKEQIFNKLQLNLDPLLTPAPAEEVQPETVPPESTTAVVDSTAESGKPVPADTADKAQAQPADSTAKPPAIDTSAVLPQPVEESDSDTSTTK